MRGCHWCIHAQSLWNREKRNSVSIALWWREHSGAIRASDLLREYDGTLDIGGGHHFKRRSGVPKGTRIVTENHCQENTPKSSVTPKHTLAYHELFPRHFFDIFYCTHQKIHMDRVQVVTTTCPMLKWKRKASRKWVTSSSVSSFNQRKPPFGITIHSRGVILAKLTRCLHRKDSSDSETS